MVLRKRRAPVVGGVFFLLCCCLMVAPASADDASSSSSSSAGDSPVPEASDREPQSERPEVGGPPEDGSSFIDQYEAGVQAYLANEWENCAYFLERALEGYRTYYESVANCRLECEYAARDVRNRGDFLHGSNVDNLQHYELILRRTLCLSKCARKYAIYRYLPFSEDFDGHYMDIFQDMKAYPYLHACYTKTNQVTLAASAAFTYLVRHPEDTIMKKSFEETIEKPGIDRDEIRDLEERKFVDLLIGGIVDEQEKNWDRAIEQLEDSVMQFIFDENQCRAFCDGEFDHGFLPDFITAIGNHFTNTLYCKRNCTSNMGMVRGKYYENLFPRHFRYLQNAYYHVKKYEQSYRAGMSYLLFVQDDIDMPESLKMIEADVKGSVTANFFKPRREAVEYYDRMVYEEKLVQFVKEEFDQLDRENPGEDAFDQENYDEDDDDDDDDDDTYTLNTSFSSDAAGSSSSEAMDSEKDEPPVDAVNELYREDSVGYSERDEL